MLGYTIRRLVGAVPLLLGVAVLSFLFMHFAPGGPDALFARNARMTAEQLAAIRHNMGLDQPGYVQLWRWVSNLARGDLGTSYSQYRPVSQVIWEVFPNTVLLMGSGLVIALVLSLVFGIAAARRPFGLFDNVTSFVSYFGLAMPVFWFGLMLQILFAVQLGWLPSAGMTSPLGGGPLDVARHLALPAFTIAIGSIAGWSRYIRSSTVEQLQQDYVRTARAKGIEENRVVAGHVLRNALIAPITLLGVQFALLIGGAVVTERVFARQGLGSMLVEAVLTKDTPLVQGLIAYTTLAYVAVNLVVDLLYGWIDPRVRQGGEA